VCRAGPIGGKFKEIFVRYQTRDYKLLESDRDMVLQLLLELERIDYKQPTEEQLGNGAKDIITGEFVDSEKYKVLSIENVT